MKKFISKSVPCVLAVAVMAFAATAQADMVYSFTQLTNNGAPDVSGQLKVTVSDAGPGKVDFKFTNEGPVQSSITGIYFDDGSLLGISDVTSSAGVSFSQGGAPPNLPGGNLASPAFQTTAGFLATSDAPVNPNGIHNTGNQFATIHFDLLPGMSFNDTIAALADGSLRIGLHIQGFADGRSESYINNGNGVIPAPGALLLVGIGLGCAGALRRRLA